MTSVAPRPVRSVLIANRGEIALRIARTCREMGIRTVAIYSTADRHSPHVAFADAAVHVGPPPARRSYLYVPSIIEAALQHGVDAVHPGYGFLSEDPDFAQACSDTGLVFVGPPSAVMELLGDKAQVRTLMAAAGLPVLPGSAGTVSSVIEAQRIAEDIGYPLVIKAAAGGGGRGIEIVQSAAELPEVFRRTVAFARQVFGNGEVYLERYVVAARHVEVQLLCDAAGGAIHLGERDCSMQRRKQKLIEESPSPLLAADLRAQVAEYAVTGARRLGYVGVGTMEMLIDSAGAITFMEINGRIQVEHPVSEMRTGIDLVREQLLVAGGRPLTCTQADVVAHGTAIECRINAEDPDTGFRPTPGRLCRFRPPGGPGVRVDSGFVEGDLIPPDYDSLLAKMVVWAPDRAQAIARADRALAEFLIDGPGVCTTIPLLRRLLAHPEFIRGGHSTRFVDELMAGADPTRWAA